MARPGIRIAIIGAGCSGTAAAISILRKNIAEELFLIDKSSNFHKGVAYGTKHSEHLLNVPAKKMSIIKEEPDHLLQWLRKNSRPYNEDAFIPRMLYGEYLADTYKEAEEKTETSVTRVVSEALGVRASNQFYIVSTESREIEVDKIIFASGWQSSEGVPEGIPASFEYDSKAIIIGTGLTAIDSYLTLRKAGLHGEITMISRRGILAKVHNLKDPPDETIKSPDKLTVTKLIRIFRDRSKEREKAGLSWHGVIDAFRPLTKSFWKSMSNKEKSSFLRHLRPYWDAHRHRMPEEVGEIIHSDLKSGKLKVLAGRVESISEESKKGISLNLRHRHANYTSILHADCLVKADGVTVFSNNRDVSLYSSLVRNNLASLDTFSLGFNITENYELINKDGVISFDLFAIGPLARGTYWETTAVPEISDAALYIARHLEAAKN